MSKIVVKHGKIYVDQFDLMMTIDMMAMDLLVIMQIALNVF